MVPSQLILEWILLLTVLLVRGVTRICQKGGGGQAPWRVGASNSKPQQRRWVSKGWGTRNFLGFFTKMWKIGSFIEEFLKNLDFCGRKLKNLGVILKNLSFPWAISSRLPERLKVVGITYFMVRIKAPRQNWKISPMGEAFHDRGPWPRWCHPCFGSYQGTHYYSSSEFEDWTSCTNLTIITSCTQSGADSNGDYSLFPHLCILITWRLVLR